MQASVKKHVNHYEEPQSSQYLHYVPHVPGEVKEKEREEERRILAKIHQDERERSGKWILRNRNLPAKLREEYGIDDEAVEFAKEMLAGERKMVDHYFAESV